LKKTSLLYSGLLPPVLFWATNLCCGVLLPGYNPAERLVSELGALGTKTQYLFTVGLLGCALFSSLFIVALYHSSKKFGVSVVPVLLLAVYPFSVSGAALFPFPLALHEILGLPAVLLFLSPLSALIFWSNKKIRHCKFFSMLALLVMLSGFLIYAPSILKGLYGIKQRFFHVGWTIWFLYLCFTFVSLTVSSAPKK
jgi:hypothetical protein